MTTYILGLGNPEPRYGGTRHNAGRMLARGFAEKFGFGEFRAEKEVALVSKGKVGENYVLLILPEILMNNSGRAAAFFVKPARPRPSGRRAAGGPKKTLENLIVLHDDIDLPLGKFKIVFNRGSGGHKGVESVRRALKTEAFVRVRIGICPKKPARGGSALGGKPNHRELLKFLTGKFKPSEAEAIKKLSKKISEALETIVKEGYEKAMSLYNR